MNISGWHDLNAFVYKAFHRFHLTFYSKFVKLLFGHEKQGLLHRPIPGCLFKAESQKPTGRYALSPMGIYEGVTVHFCPSKRIAGYGLFC
jgi:hypothetical protein